MAQAASAEYRRRGSIATSEGVNGALYRIGQREYVLTDDDAVFVLHGRSQHPRRVHKPDIIARVTEQAAIDHEIASARDALAVEHANGDELLTTALRMHLEYSSGHLGDPYVVDGIAFYRVGHNASVEFSVGTKDGKCYVCSCGEGFISAEDVATMEPAKLEAIHRNRLIEETENGLIFYEEHVHEAPHEWQGCYLGHF